MLPFEIRSEMVVALALAIFKANDLLICTRTGNISYEQWSNRRRRGRETDYEISRMLLLEICLEMVNVFVSAILLSLCFLDFQGN